MSAMQRAIIGALVGSVLWAGCATSKPVKYKGGSGKRTITTATNGVTTTVTEITQPDNPAAESSQDYERTTKREIPIPAGSQVVQESVAVDQRGVATTNRTSITLAAPTILKEDAQERSGQKIGAAQIPPKDSASDTKARLSAMRPVQYAGIALILGALALCYFGWWTKAAIVGGCGIGMVVIAAVIPGHEGLILGVGLVAAVVGCLLVLYIYYKGHHDAANTQK